MTHIILLSRLCRIVTHNTDKVCRIETGENYFLVTNELTSTKLSACIVRIMWRQTLLFTNKENYIDLLEHAARPQPCRAVGSTEVATEPIVDRLTADSYCINRY